MSVSCKSISTTHSERDGAMFIDMKQLVSFLYTINSVLSVFCLNRKHITSGEREANEMKELRKYLNL